MTMNPQTETAAELDTRLSRLDDRIEIAILRAYIKELEGRVNSLQQLLDLIYSVADNAIQHWENR